MLGWQRRLKFEGHANLSPKNPIKITYNHIS